MRGWFKTGVINELDIGICILTCIVSQTISYFLNIMDNVNVKDLYFVCACRQRNVI